MLNIEKQKQKVDNKKTNRSNGLSYFATVII